METIKTEFAGQVVFWGISGDTSARGLRSAIEPMGFDVPEPSEYESLKRAVMSVHHGPDTIVRPLDGRSGWTVLQEFKGVSENAYSTIASARLTSSGNVIVDRGQAYEINCEFLRFRDQLSSAALARVLCRIMETYRATTLRPSGGLYFLPAAKQADWERVAKAVEAWGNSKIYTLTVTRDGQALRAIRDAIVAEVNAETQVINSAVLTGNQGKRALETKAARARELRAKVRDYERILQSGLSDLHAALEASANKAGIAAIAVAAARIAA